MAGDRRALVDSGAPGMTDQLPAWQYLAGYAALYAKDYDAAIAALGAADQRDPFVLALLAQAFAGSGDAAKATGPRMLSAPAYAGRGPYAVGVSTLELADRSIEVYYPAKPGSTRPAPRSRSGPCSVAAVCSSPSCTRRCRPSAGGRSRRAPFARSRAASGAAWPMPENTRLSGELAQWLEQRNHNPLVRGSNP